MMKKLISLMLFSLVVLYACKEAPATPQTDANIAPIRTEMAENAVFMRPIFGSIPLRALSMHLQRTFPF